VTDDQVRALRMRAQGLDGSGGDAVDVVRRVVGLPAQLLPASPLAVRARSRGLTAADVDRARLEERSIVWTWAMRGTLHLVAAEDLGWMNALFGPVGVARGRRRLRELGVDEDAAVRGVAVIRDALARHGPLTRGAIAEELRAGGVDVEPGTQAVIHLIFRAALEGVLCGGPDQDGEPAYALLSDWVKVEPPDSEEAALAELARRYFAGYGPATTEDLATWSGLPMAQVREAARLGGGEVPRDLPKEPIVRLLGSFDPYLLGYRGRDLAVAPEHARRILPGGGVLRPTAIVDGRAVAVWRQQKRGNRLHISLEPFEELDAEIARRLEADAQDLARFVDAELRLG
jgi:Winged helix DNA-binding domain